MSLRSQSATTAGAKWRLLAGVDASREVELAPLQSERGRTARVPDGLRLEPLLRQVEQEVA
jgi:hypothetical protein